MSRVEKALAFVDRDGFGLEIGPSHAPIAPKRAGFNVDILDYMGADGLREKFKDEGVDLSQIEDVDYVWGGEPLYELVGGKAKYDWIIASHVIEHVPDLASFLGDCEEVLRPEGVVSLIIPDKRYCFDHFRPHTTTGQVLDALERRSKRPTPGSVFDHVANSVEIAWSSGQKAALSPTYSFDRARFLWDHAIRSGDYVDAHNWCFTPTSFRLILQDLNSLGLTGLHVAHEFETVGLEFFVTLGRGPEADSSLERIAVLRQIDRELAAGTGLEQPAEGPRDGSGIAIEVSQRERQLIALKRRLFEKIRGTSRRRT